jgi:hypothetical protein
MIVRCVLWIVFFMARQPLVGQGLLIVEALRSHSDTPTLGRIPLDESQKPLPGNTQHSQETVVHAPEGFEPAVPLSERPQTNALDRAVTGIGF